jgi:diguanylate cyclase (GGDEF)-like protein/PAS domain S-box-containing protein
MAKTDALPIWDPNTRKAEKFSVTRTLAFLLAPLVLTLYFPTVAGPVEISYYLPLHTLFETFAISVAILVFAIGWSSYTQQTTPALLALSTGFLGVALLDFGHLLSYAGMPDFVTSSGPEKAIAFWLAARFIAAVALLAAALLSWKPEASDTRRYPLIGATLLAVAAVYGVTLWFPDTLPRTFIPGQGLTTTKLYAEYALVLLYGGAALAFHWRRRRPSTLDAPRLIVAAVAIAISELCFTLYFSVYDLSNATGHVYKVIGYWYLYRAIFVTSVHHPYDALNRSQWELWAEKERMRVTLLSIGDGLIATDTDGRVTLMNRASERLTGWTMAEALGKPVSDVFAIESAESGQAVGVPVEQVLRDGQIVGLANHTVLVSRDGRRSHIADTAAPIRDRNGALHGVVLIFQDVTETYNSREALKDSLSLNKGVLESAACGVIATSLDGVVRVFNREAEEITGYSAKEMLEQPASALLRLHDADELRVQAERMSQALQRPIKPDFEVFVAATRENGLPEQREWTCVRKDGARRLVSLVVSVLRDSGGVVRGYLAIMLDVTEKKRAERQIERLAYYDPLTDLPNRRLLLEILGQALRTCRRTGRVGALLFLDLDHFKNLNDARGHTAGDALLRQLAQRLSGVLRKGEMVSRLSGDEFVILLPDLGADQTEAASAAHQVADKLRLAVALPFHLDQQDYSLFASVGLTVFPKTPVETVDDILIQADSAMYAAKDSGRNSVREFDPLMRAEAEARLRLEQDLRKAVEGGEFTLFLQPQTTADGALIAAEALVRWNHPTRGLVAPGAFIAVAENSGLILPLGDWILAEACRILRRLEDAGSSCHLSVNISPRQFRQSNFCATVIDIMNRTRVNPRRLTLEITEGIAIDDVHDTVAKMRELSACGVSFSLDDFGTGYSSLSYLKQLPVSELKIDRSFIQDVDGNSHNAALVEIILSIADRLGLRTVAEGVETAEDRDFLKERGCAVFQGYYFNRPIPVDVFFQTYPPPAASHDITRRAEADALS